MTAPVGEVTTPMRRGSIGSGRLRAGSKSPSFSSLSFSSSNACCSEPLPSGSSTCDGDLVLAARRVDAQRAAGQDLHPVLRAEADEPRVRLPDDRADLRLLVLQREVPVARGGELQVRDLALDPHVHELGLEDALDALGQLGDGEGAPPNRAVAGTGRSVPRGAGLGGSGTPASRGEAWRPEVEALLAHA